METEHPRVDPEKITINLTPVDLGKIDLLVEQGLYASRSDLIRTGLRRLLEEHGDVVQRSVANRSLVVGAQFFGRSGLEKLRNKKEKVRARVVGLLHIGADVSPELADEVFENIAVVGVFRAPAAVQERLAPKTERRS